MASSGTIQLSEDDISYLITLLRNSATPLTTAQLVNALRQRGSR